VIRHSDKFLSYYSSSSSPGGFPFPASLRNLNLNGVETPVPLSNLTSLESLNVYGYSRGSRAEKISLWPLLTQGCLTKLSLYGTPIFFVGPDPEASWSHHGQGLPPRLGEIETNDVGGILATPICSLLSSSLTKLVFYSDNEVESFTEEQEKAIQLLTSLQHLGFRSCHHLQCLPAGLRVLPDLKILEIFNCKSIQSLPQDGLPSSLQELHIRGCPAIRSLPMEALPSSLQQLTIGRCPAIIQSLHEDSIPSSLRVLDVRRTYGWGADRMQLRRRLTGTVPILRI
jgi:Leucine-rich repeat (LRR) protein